MRIFISGPMTGIPLFNVPEFNRAARELRALGYEVFNPGECEPGMSWGEYMKLDLIELLKCDGVALLPGYSDSPGSRIEVVVANTVNIPCVEVAWWCSYPYVETTVILTNTVIHKYSIEPL